MDQTDLGQKAAQRLNMDRADSLLGLGKLFRDFSGHFGEFYHFHKVMCFSQLDSLPCAACKDLLVLSSAGDKRFCGDALDVDATTSNHHGVALNKAHFVVLPAQVTPKR